MLNITTNLSSIITQRSLNKSTQLLNQAIERMSTGYKLNHASDNAANYSISTNLTTRLGAYQVAEDNAAQGLDMLTTANESLNLISDHLVRIRALAEQAANGTYGAQSLEAINSEVNARVDEIERLYNTAEYNGINLFKGENVGETKFLQDIVRQDTSKMTKLSDVNDEITSGTYSISTAEELSKLAEMTNNGLIKGGEFVLANDIDLSMYDNWTPIGNNTNHFKGIFDGNGYEISNLKINCNKEMQGLFGIVRNSTILNLGVIDANISCQKASGLMIGCAIGDKIIINNCYTTGLSKTFGADASGILAYSDARKIEIDSCYTGAIIEAAGASGGIIASTISDISINNSYFLGDLSRVGNSSSGFLGYFAYNKSVNITNSANYGIMKSGIKQFVGYSVSTTGVSISDCKYLGDNMLCIDSPNVKISNVEKVRQPEPLNYGALYEGKQKDMQVGVNASSSSQIGINTSFVLPSLDNLSLDKIDDLLEIISAKQTEYGAAQNRLESALDEISTQYENILSSRSTLKDADIAKVSSQYIKEQILQQASATLMSTANQTPALALQLL